MSNSRPMGQIQPAIKRSLVCKVISYEWLGSGRLYHAHTTDTTSPRIHCNSLAPSQDLQAPVPLPPLTHFGVFVQHTQCPALGKERSVHKKKQENLDSLSVFPDSGRPSLHCCVPDCAFYQCTEHLAPSSHGDLLTL